MNTITKEFTKMMQQFGITNDDTIIVAISGGIDSMCLLHLLVNNNFAPIVAHVNHNIRPESTDDERFIKDECTKKNLQFEVHTIKKGTFTQKSFEEEARTIRYDFFSKLIKKYKAKGCLLAHHLNDSCETMIFHLTRGTGLKGLTGIPAQRDCWFRPLTSVTRNEIETYCKSQNISWREDSTNNDNTYKRNFIRHEIIPQLTELTPSALENMHTTQKILKDSYDFIEECAEKWLTTKPYNVSNFKNLHSGLQTAIITRLYMIENPNAHPASHHHINQIITVLCSGTTGKQKEFGPEKYIRLNKGIFEIKKR